MIPYDPRHFNPGSGVFPHPADPRFFADQQTISMGGIDGRNFEGVEMQRMDPRILTQPYAVYPNMSINTMGSGIVPPDYAMYPGSAPRSVRSGTDTPAAIYGTQGSAVSETGSRRSNRSQDRVLTASRPADLSTSKEVIQDGQLTIESSLCFAPQTGQGGGVSASSISHEGIRLNLPPLPIESSSLSGAASDHVVVQMGKD